MEQTRRPGRPAAKQEGSEETMSLNAPITNTAKKVLKHNYEEPTGPEISVYEIRKNHGITFMITQSNTTVYDKKTNSVRSIRYCPNENSIFTDEQSQYAKKEAIIFRDGVLVVPVEKPNLKQFLDIHPSNIANGGSVFNLVNNKVNIEQELKGEFDVFDAVALVREKHIDELLPVAIYYNVNVDRPVSEIKYDLLRIAKSKPHDFVKSFDNPIVKTRSIIYKAVQYDVIKAANDGCYWTDSGGLIVAVPVGQEPIDTLTRFCMSERGAQVLTSIEDRLVNT